MQEPSTKRTKLVSRVTSLASLLPPVKTAPLKRISQTLQVRPRAVALPSATRGRQSREVSPLSGSKLKALSHMLHFLTRSKVKIAQFPTVSCDFFLNPKLNSRSFLAVFYIFEFGICHRLQNSLKNISYSWLDEIISYATGQD